MAGLARRRVQREGLTIELGSLPEDWARNIPDEAQDLCVDFLGKERGLARWMLVRRLEEDRPTGTAQRRAG